MCAYISGHECIHTLRVYNETWKGQKRQEGHDWEPPSRGKFYCQQSNYKPRFRWSFVVSIREDASVEITDQAATTESACMTRSVWEDFVSNFIQPIRLQLDKLKCKSLKVSEDILAGETATAGCCHSLLATKFKCCCSRLQSYMCLLLESKHYPISSTFMCQNSPWPTAEPQVGRKARGQSVVECKQHGEDRES